MTSYYTASGARRTGDNYQDIQSAKVLVEWLEQPENYNWVRLEVMDGALDDIQAERVDSSRRFLQIKHGVDNTNEWTWDELIKQEQGKKGLKPSLLKKWKNSLDDIKSKGIAINEAALLTNRAASVDICNHLSSDGLVDFQNLPTLLQTELSKQLGGKRSAGDFFKSFHFRFANPSLEALEDSLFQRFRRLGGTLEGWGNLMKHIQYWINHQNVPNSNGFINLANVRTAALWHVPAQIPQGFLVPHDYVSPQDWSDNHVKKLLQTGSGLLVVTGSPGAGKSTYLSWLVDKLRDEKIPVIRHHYFLSTTDDTRFRTKSEIAANALIAELLHSYSKLVIGVNSENPTPDKLPEFLKAAGCQRGDNLPLVLIIDGLDHVWRDTGSEEELRKLFELLLPVPKGVVILVGTQDIDIAKIPTKLRDLCPHSQWLKVPNLNKGNVQEWLAHHRHKFLLPEDQEQADSIFFGLVDAFYTVSAGHPLILHYILNKVLQNNSEVCADHVLQLPRFDANSNVATYYQGIWNSINPQGHQLLHLLAGFSWAWPRDGLVQCLNSHANHAELEQAEQAIRHVLGDSPAGITAFHESLLAFVRALKEHRTAVTSLRSQVITWLTDKAPDYWRWRHEWEERAKGGETAPLIELATLDWCVDSLVAGRELWEIGKIVAASGWAALNEQKLGIATQRHYLDVYLENASHIESVFLHLKLLAFHRLDAASLEQELNLFLAHKASASLEEIAAITEIAFLHGHHDICRKLRRECGDRWNTKLKKQKNDIGGDEFTSLKEYLPPIIAASLKKPLSDEPYQRYFAEYGEAPDWCRSNTYAKALIRLCVIGNNTAAQREELRFLANQSGNVSFEVVDEIVRLACRDGFKLSSWVTSAEAEQSGLFRCHQLWLEQRTFAAFSAIFSFQAIPQHDVDHWKFIELAHAYFFSCLANVVQGHASVKAIDVNPKAVKVAEFLLLLSQLAIKAANCRKTGQTLGAAWLIEQLANITPPEKLPGDDYWDNRCVERPFVTKLIVAIAQDLEELHFAEFNKSSLNADILKKSIESKWTWASTWINDCVERQIVMYDTSAAQFLIAQEKNRLAENLDTLHQRAEEYGCN
jgi:hypothetical protein